MKRIVILACAFFFGYGLGAFTLLIIDSLVMKK